MTPRMPLDSGPFAPGVMPPLPAPPAALAERAGRWLSVAASAWCVAAVSGQLLFAAYVALFYGAALVDGRPERWSTVMPDGWVPGQTAANLALSAHLAFAVFILLSGAVQLIPRLRSRLPALHRWNGRLYILGALLLGVGGIVMVWTRRTPGDTLGHVSVSINGALIVGFAVATWRMAVARRIEHHRRWALRLWLAVGGVWFFRLGLTAWLMVNQGPRWFDPRTFQGPFLTVLGIAQYVLPLLVLQAWLHARDRGGWQLRAGMAAVLAALTLLTVFGTFSATMILWLPRLR